MRGKGPWVIIMSVFGLIALVTLVTLIGARRNAGEISTGEIQGSQSGRKVRVVTTIYPLYDFVQRIGRDKVDAVNLVPPGVEPHDWEPRPRTLAMVEKADIFIYNGAGFEKWISKLLSGMKSHGLVVIDGSKSVSLIQSGPRGGGRWTPDPHIWLDPVNAKALSEMIKDALVVADPGNKNSYEANATEFARELDALDAEYRAVIGKARRKEIITSHTAFAYLARRYGLQQIPIAGLGPDVEPSPAKLAAIVTFARDRNIRYVFLESLANPKVVRVVADEIGAEPLVLNPIEGLTKEEMAKGKDYLALMRENLATLRKALENNNGR